MASWGVWHRVAFRFAFALTVPICIVMLLSYIPFADHRPLIWIANGFWSGVGTIERWLTELVFGFTPQGMLQGSDSEAAWMRLAWTAIFAVLATAVWSLVSKRHEHRVLADLHRTLVRHTLVIVLLAYGIEKVFALQMWTLSPTDLVQTYGQSTRFALAWRFLGASTPYQMFSGTLECIAALLLVWRRTTLAGALVAAAVLANVVMLNLNYQVPVKHYSLTFLALTTYLVLPHARRLFDVAILHRTEACDPIELRPYRFGPRGELVRTIIKLVWIALLLGDFIYVFANARTTSWRGGRESSMWGIYDVEAMDRDGKPVPLVITDPHVWQQVAFGYAFADAATVITVDGVRHEFGVALDATQHKLKLTDDDGKETTLDLARPDATHLELTGDYEGHPLHVRLRAHGLADQRFLHQQLQWIDDGGQWE